MAPLVVLLLKMLSTVSFTFILTFGCDGAGRALRPTVSLCCWLFGQATPVIDLMRRMVPRLGRRHFRIRVAHTPVLPVPVLIAMVRPGTRPNFAFAGLVHADVHRLDLGHEPVCELRAAHGQRGGHAATCRAAVDGLASAVEPIRRRRGSRWQRDRHA